MLSRRDAMAPAERAAASTAIAERAAAACGSTLAPVRVAALYAPKGSEVDTAELDAALRASGIAIAYPRVLEARRELVFAGAKPDELVAARFGLREPAAGAPEVPLASIDVFFMPGIAFDRSGARLGWGRGHYDATLAAAPRARRVGLAFECQLLPHVAREPHDALLHYIVTELAVHAGGE